MNEKVFISLTPYQAMEIMTFFEAMKEDIQAPKFAALRECIKAYNDEVTVKISMDQITDAYAERAMNELLDKAP